MIHRPELMARVQRRWGFEFKCQDAPTMTRSIRSSMQDLGLERVWVVYPGTQRYLLAEKVECVGVTDLPAVRRAVTGERTSR